MKIYSRLKTYFNAPSRCFIPKCKAVCCTNAPLPEDFLQKHVKNVQRRIYSGINIGLNDPRDTFNSVVYNTTTNPIQLIGVNQNGERIAGIPPEMVKNCKLKAWNKFSS